MKTSTKIFPILLFSCMVYASSIIAQINSIGGFEGDLPSYWTKGSEPGGATLTWASDEFRSLGRSLKISKTTTTDSAAWISENMVDLWSPQHLMGVDIKVGAYVKTENVNTNPTTDDERWWISYTFWNSVGGLIGETKLLIDQSVASSTGWVADTNAVAETILAEDAWTTIIKFVGGKNATGTVWVDDFIFLGRGGVWAGDAWNNSVAYPTGWIDWLQPNGGKDGTYERGFENTVVTDAESHSGLRSLKFDLPADHETGDGWVGTKRFLLNDSGLGDAEALRISVWVKAENLVPDSADVHPVTWAIGFTYGFFKGNGNNEGWNPIGGSPIDTQFTLPSVTSFDWTQFDLDVWVPNDPETQALAVRLHVYSRFTGTAYFDDLTVEPIAPTPGGQTFTRITTGDIVNDGAASYGAAWGDYNNDGYLDLFVGNWGQNNFLYQNDRDGTFTKIFAGEIVNDLFNTHSISWGDYNNDGDLDLFVSESILYSNNGDGTFTKTILIDLGGGINCSWGDYDSDGYLDLFLVRRNNQNNFLYRNNGDGTFAKITTGIIVNDGGHSYASTWGDYDNDGDLDLFVANGGLQFNLNNVLYQNNGDGTFTKITGAIVVEDGGRSMGGSWGDYNNDGYLDLFVTNGGATESQNNFLYRNNGDGTFSKITSGDIVNDGGKSWSSSWGDFDNDGDLDLYATNGAGSGENNFLYSNNGDGTFTKVISGDVVNDNTYSLGVISGDYDNDGDLDLFVANDNGLDNFLYANDGNMNNWINIKCVGTVSNTSAIGAKVRVKANISGNSVWQMNEISGQTGGGFGGQNSLNAEFGLGDATVVDSIRIEWPSGAVEVFTDVPVNLFVLATEGNSSPVAVNDSVTTLEDTTITIATLTLVTNDADVDGNTLTLQSIDTSGTLGTVEINPGDTTITYTPIADFNGNDTFTYTIIDGNLGGKDTATVVVTVTPVNDSPVAVNDTVTTLEDTFVTIDVLTNDTDVDGDTLMVQSVDTVGTIGTVVIAPGDTTITYTPKADFNGNDTFNYTISDGKSGTDTAMVVVTVTPVQDRPIAVNDSIATPEDNVIAIAVLTNDIDVDGEILKVQSVDTVGTIGTVGIDPGNITITYTPKPNFNGNDTFLYTISDGNVGGSDTATVFLTVTQVNDRPIAVNDTVTTLEDTSITVAISDMLANDTDEDGDTLTLQSIITTSTIGTVIIDLGDTTITYTPQADFNGEDTFNYTISDGKSGTDTAMVVVAVTPVQDRPIAVNDSTATPEDNVIAIAVLTNDADVDGDTLMVQSVDTVGTIGTVGIDPGNITITYTPKPNFNGNDTFLYTISDGNVGGSDTAMVFVTVTQVNDGPIAVNDTVTTAEDSSITVAISDMLANDTDEDGDTLTLQSIITASTIGTVVIAPGDTTITCTPKADFNGKDTFNYTISDGKSGTDTAMVVVTVTPVNDAPLSFDLIYPLDGATIDSSTITFVWRKSVDVDLDTMQYTLHLSGAGEDTAFSNLSDTLLIFNGFNFIQVDTIYTWHVKATDGIETAASTTQNQFRTAATLVSVDEVEQIPTKFFLSQNYPNPFNPETRISYEVAKHTRVILRIINLRGQQVRTLVNEEKPAGFYEVLWDGKNSHGQRVASGIYLYRLESREFVQTRKMVFLQ
jgi:hypothetical protein